jgi:hypothetical protein
VDSGKREQAYSLAMEISHCPVMVECLQGADHPCRRVVLAQWPTQAEGARLRRWPREHHLPEPWVGHLWSAPLLFLSSNPAGAPRPHEVPPDEQVTYALPPELQGKSADDFPSLRRPFQAPKWRWSYEEVFDRYTTLFDLWVDGSDQRPRVPVGLKRPKASPYWVSAKQQADALFRRDTVPGVDYTLTEVVHCKSMKERGVGRARRECVPRYLRRLLRLSPATLVIVYGDHARNTIRAEFDYPHPGVVTEPIDAEGLSRRFAFLAHPSSTKPKRPKELPDHDLAAARQWLSQDATGDPGVR